MARIVHVIEPERIGWSGLTAARLTMDRCGGHEHRAVLIGGSRGESLARRCGIDCIDRVVPANGRAVATAGGLRRLIRARGPFDLVHAWSIESAQAARRAAARLPLVVCPGDAPDATRRIALTRLLNRWRADLAVFPSEAASSMWRRIGEGSWAASLVAPHPVVPGRFGGARREIRAEWKLRDDEVALLALGEPGSAVNGKTMSIVAGMMTHANRPAAAVLPPDAIEMVRALRFRERHLRRWRMIIDDRPAFELFDACDVGVWIRSDDGAVGQSRLAVNSTAPVRWAVATNLPVVASWPQMRTEHDELPGAVVRSRSGRPIDLVRGILRALEGRHTSGSDDELVSSCARWVVAMESAYARLLHAPASAHLPTGMPSASMTGAAPDGR